MNFGEWIATVPEAIRNDALWKLEAYRLALFAGDLAWRDATRLFRDGRTLRLAAQLYDSVGSVSANLSEGYSRGSPRDRARFYEYALGSGRESRTWYFGARHVLGELVSHHRIGLHTQIIRLVLSMLPATRGYALHDEFSAAPQAGAGLDSSFPDESASLLVQVPMPDDPLTEHGTRNTEHGTRRLESP